MNYLSVYRLFAIISIVCLGFAMFFIGRASVLAFEDKSKDKSCIELQNKYETEKEKVEHIEERYFYCVKKEYKARLDRDVVWQRVLNCKVELGRCKVKK
jgi:hypothetical protein